MSSLKVRIKLDNKCENNCWYCLSDDKSDTHMSDEMMETAIKKMREIYSKGDYTRAKIVLTGGDPFRTDNPVKITKMISQEFKGILSPIVCDVCITSKLDFIQQFKELGGAVLLSLNEDSLEDIVEMSKFITRRHIFLFNVLLTNYNMDRMDKIVDAVIQYKLPLRLNHLFDPEDKNNLLPRMLETVDYVYPRLKNEGFKYNNFNYPFGCWHVLKGKCIDYCGYGRDHYFIDVYGNVRRCQMEESISTIYSETLEQDIKKEVILNPKCNTCDILSICKGGCPHTNKYGKYCDLQHKIVNYLIDLDPMYVQPCSVNMRTIIL
jgi:radical SAM protein with 4Fe4S-binding SPASM domain